MRKLVRESMKININNRSEDMFSKDLSRNDLINVNYYLNISNFIKK